MLNISSELIYLVAGAIFFIALVGLLIIQAYQSFRLKHSHQALLHSMERKLTEQQLLQTQQFSDVRLGLLETISSHNGNLLATLKNDNTALLTTANQHSASLMDSLKNHKVSLLETLGTHNEGVVGKFKDLSLQLEKRLNEGFEKTTITFSDIVKRLALIDDAQKKLTELSSNVVSLQEILMDKRSRGAFGEIQLKSLVQNVLPSSHFSLQHTLSNGLRVDCILFLPEPTGNVVIDSKFPLENYQIMTDFNCTETEKKKAQQQFRQDIKKHIQDIASKYILPNETADGAIMFIPAEAVFAEIHAHFPDLVEISHRSNVWLTSPTTLMAILTTARAVLKDQATREHIHIIQEHLRYLAEDFQRFDTRMQNLAKHMEQANKDVQQVQTSAKKISQRFTQIEKAEVGQAPTALLDSFPDINDTPDVSPSNSDISDISSEQL